MPQSQQPSDHFGTSRASQLTAVLGPTNTGKTHLAIERMLGHNSGLIGLPLRLLAREVYDRIVAKIGPQDVALITGEEKIKPRNARYWVSTVEAMPRDLDVEFVAVDEIQLAADSERGHVFTDRLFHARGSEETLLLGAETMRNPLSQLLTGVNYVSRPRLSKLTYAGPKKISRLPRRSAIVAFSARDVYEIAEFVRRQRGGAAVVLGALSPRTRNAQVEMFQSGDVDYLIATDAIGMGLNLDVNHVAFAGNRKFDGAMTRNLFPHEIAQIAGRAGRHIKDGTFGVTGNVPPFSSELVTMIEAHEFEPVTALQWRARQLDFASAPRLLASLRQPPGRDFLVMARDADDVRALEVLSADKEIRDIANNPSHVQRLWNVCQVPDYRKISPHDHHDLIRQLLEFLLKDEGQIPEDWMAEQINQHDNATGDIDSLAARIAYIRTWTFIANRPDWLKDPEHWQEKARAIEDKLSDALHEGLTKRFVDQRTSTLMRRLRDNDELYVEIDDQGQLMVEDHFVGELAGFNFTPDHAGEGVHGRAARAAAVKVLSKELMMRSKEMTDSPEADFQISLRGEISWREAVVGQLAKGDHILRPKVTLLADEQLVGTARDEAEAKLQQIASQYIEARLGPLIELEKAEDISGLARGVAFQLVEGLGVLRREPIANDIRQLDQDARGQLRKYGVRFGAFHIYFPLLLKPAASEAARLLWLLFHEKMALAEGWEMPRAGLTSTTRTAAIEPEYYLIGGFSCCGGRVVRVDMLERLADIIRPLVSYRGDATIKGETDAVIASEDQVQPSTDETGREGQPAPSKEADPQPQLSEEQGTPGEEGKPHEVEEAVTKAKAVAAKKDHPPCGATGDGGFVAQPDMMSIMGCSQEELGDILRALGFRASRQGDGESRGPNSKRQTETDAPKAAIEMTEDTGAASDGETQSGADEIIIWRPRKKSGNRGKQARQKPGKGRSRKTAKGKGNGMPPKGKKRTRGTRDEAVKPVDPNSPFAKLAELKDKIQDKAG